MAEIRLEHITQSYAPAIRAVDDLSLTVADGELVVLVGPSGCGKTTTLRLIAGLETPTAGLIRIDGRVVNAVPPRQRDVALVFQRPTLYPHLSVEANLAFGVQMRHGLGLWRRGLWHLFRPAHYATAVHQLHDLKSRISDTARVLGLTELLDRRPWQLSGGEQQRVALGRALVRQPAVFLLDEPLSNLDPALRHDLRRQLHLLQRRLRATMVYVTHDQVEAMTLGDQVVVLDGGKVQQVGPPALLYQRPANRFVAGFLGWPPMNFIDGKLGRDNRGWPILLTQEGCFPLPDNLGAVTTTHEGQTLTLGLRPEHVRLAEEAEERGGNPHLIMEVLLVETLGATSLVTLGRGRWQLLAHGERRPSLRERQTVKVELDMKRGHLFDKASGLALGGSIPAG